MPKKTKKQKISAEKRKELYKHEISNLELKNDTSVKYTTYDLKKTLVISSILFALEFLVFYANLKSIILK